MRQKFIAICALFAVLCGAALGAPVGSADKQPDWLVGYWKITYDEDGNPPDWTEFKSNGEFRVISPQCNVAAGYYHIYDGDAYLTFTIPGKGPVALVYRPSKDKKTLFYTSIRTRHTAAYEKVTYIPCKLPN